MDNDGDVKQGFWDFRQSVDLALSVVRRHRFAFVARWVPGRSRRLNGLGLKLSGDLSGLVVQAFWTDEDTEALIRWRGANDVFFTGRRNASLSGFQTYIKDMELEGKVEALWAKKKWENLKQKYKIILKDYKE
ncbi:unnamed protein product [Gadus morhua 'NCC']